MFIGHFGVGFGAKKAATGVSLGLLFIAAQFLDLLWPTLLLLNAEHVAIAPGNTKSTPLNFYDYPISHSLLMVMVWAIVFGVIYWLIKKNIKYAVVLGICVVSHWALDLIVHRPDLPLYPGNSPFLGFGLWNYPMLTALLEGLIFVIGVGLYLQATKAKNGVGRFGLWVLILLLVVTHVANMFSPPPTSVTAIAW
ncbi:MAG: hypothetical protein JSS96_13240, partial [Bacteroidetes bacterium]|nr:hypothetical protein [Bacteroidota bacterium]